MSRSRALHRIRPWVRNHTIKRSEYLLYCAIPTQTVSSSIEQTNAPSTIFEDFDLATTSLDALGLGTFVIGATVFAWCKVQEMSSRNHLITRGFFKYSRNPMAMACMLSLVGGCILTHNPYFCLFMPSFGFCVLHFYAIPLEEQQLLDKFGQEYQDYMDRTHRWIKLPGIKKSEKS